MATSVKKQAAKIVSKAIEKANDQAKETVKEKSEFLKRLENSNLARETEGRDAFTNLRRLRGEKLPQGDEVIIARHLYDELLVLKRHLHAKGMGIGEFCNRFGMTDASESSKELHRLTLPPGKNPADVRLRRAAGKYRVLIEAVSKTTNESVSSLADRVLRGTNLHPEKQIGSFSEAEKLQTALQRIVDKLDDEFGLYSKFMETAKLKANHIADGGTENWPLWEISREWSSDEQFEQEIADATDPKFAFWNRPVPQMGGMWDIEKETFIESTAVNSDDIPTDWPMSYNSGVLQDQDFFYVPHAPLGVIVYADLPRRDNSPAKYEQAVQRSLAWMRQVDERTGKSWVEREYSVRDEWDSVTQSPYGQIEFQQTVGAYFAWLVIYPSRDGARLMPMLYVSQEEGGAYLLPLDARSLEIFRDAIWLDETEHVSVFDRIKKLFGYRPGTPRAIEEGFRRTAPWLDHNPHFKLKKQHTDDLLMLDAFCQQLWEEK